MARHYRPTRHTKRYSQEGIAQQTITSKKVEQLVELKKLLSTKEKIVVISGAGISVNAGCKSSSPMLLKEHRPKLETYSSRLSYVFWAEKAQPRSL